MATTIYLIRPETYPTSGFTNTKSLLFDGVDEYVDCGAVSALSNQTNISVSIWVKQLTNGLFIPFSVFDSSSEIIEFQLDSTNSINVVMRNGGSTSVGFANPTFNINTWYNVIFTYNGGGATDADKLKVYLDGSPLTLSFSGSIPSTSATLTNSLTLGGRPASSLYYNQNIDEVSIFDYELTSGQVTSIYNSGTPTDLDNTSGVTAPVHWWRMGDGDTFPTITDVGTTGGNNGTMTNMESGDIVTDVP